MSVLSSSSPWTSPTLPYPTLLSTSLQLLAINPAHPWPALPCSSGHISDPRALNPVLIISWFRIPKRFSHLEFTLSFLSQVRTSKAPFSSASPFLPSLKPSYPRHRSRLSNVRIPLQIHSVRFCRVRDNLRVTSLLSNNYHRRAGFSPSESSSCWPRNSSNINRSICLLICCISDRSRLLPNNSRNSILILPVVPHHSLHRIVSSRPSSPTQSGSPATTASSTSLIRTSQQSALRITNIGAVSIRAS